MANYQRVKLHSATYFFTVNLLERQGNSLLVQKAYALIDVVRKVKATYPSWLMRRWLS